MPDFSRKHPISRATPLAALLLLAACDGGVATTAAAYYLTASSAALIHTDKTIGDHVTSRYRDEDCALLHLEAGKDYCQRDEAGGPAAVYCYRSIAEVTCYAEPNPNETPSRQVGAVP